MLFGIVSEINQKKRILDVDLIKFRTAKGFDPLSKSRIASFQARCDDKTGRPVTCPIYWLGDSWAVTVYGLESLDGSTSVTLSELQGRGVAGDIAAELTDTADFDAAVGYIRGRYKKTYVPFYL